MKRDITINPGFVAHNQKHLPEWHERYIGAFLWINTEKYDERIKDILTSAFGMADEIASVPYVENLIKEVEEVMDGKSGEVTWSGMDGIYSVHVFKTSTKLADMDFVGELPTSEIYLLLKDWLEFLKEYYKRAFVPLEWIKEEYMEEAKKLQKPING